MLQSIATYYNIPLCYTMNVTTVYEISIYNKNFHWMIEKLSKFTYKIYIYRVILQIQIEYVIINHTLYFYIWLMIWWIVNMQKK